MTATTTQTYRVVWQTAGGRNLIDGIWTTETKTEKTVATGLSLADAETMVRESRKTHNMRAGLPGYWMAVEAE